MLKQLLFLSLFSATAFSANGSNGIAITASGRAMGGTGVSYFTNGSEALLKNPALLVEAPGKAPSFLVSGHATYVGKNSTATENNLGFGEKTNAAGSLLSPVFSIMHKINTDLSVGLGLLSFGGNSVDYTSDAELLNVESKLGLVRIPFAGSYRVNESLSVGLEPYLVYGALTANDSASGALSTRREHGAFGAGVLLGGYYKTKFGLNIALTLKTKTKITYPEVMDLDNFGTGNTVDSAPDDVTVTQPYEGALGATYPVLPELLVSLDYRFIGWNEAEVYKQLGWKNQHVIALGGQYSKNKFKARAGVNISNKTVTDFDSEALSQLNLQGHNVALSAIALLNTVAFPSFSTMHITAGGAYQVKENLEVDLSFVFSPNATLTRGGTQLTQSGPAPFSYTGKTSQWSIGVGATYNWDVESK